MSSPAQRIAALSPEEKRILLAELMRKKATGPRRFPLSFAQQRLWFLDRLAPGAPFYHISAALRLQVPLNVAALERSLNEIVRRHEALRTCFPAVEGQPVQQIAPHLALPLPLFDLRTLPADARQAEALRLATEEAQRPFDLAQGPLLRSGLLQLGPADYVFLLTLHHIVADGWSLGIFARELTALYAAFAAGRPSPLGELPIQYADYAVWQRGWLQGAVLDEQLGYWRTQLKDLPVLQLPTDRPRPAVQTFHGGYQRVTLPTLLVTALKELSQREGTTLFMTLLAAFKTLLHRYSGQEDIVAGAPVAGRNRAETEELIGFFVNTLVMRTDLSGDPTFRELLRRVRDVALGAYGHQDLPFEMLVEKLQPERDLSRNPLFQVVFQLQNLPTASRTVSGPAEPALELKSGTAKFDLTFDLREERDAHGLEGVNGQIEYNTDLFDAATIKRMAGHFHTLLESIVRDPDRPISHLALLPDAERHQLLVEWNDTMAAYPREACVHHLFEMQVEKTPEALAVVDERGQISYGELNSRANQVAHYLRRSGVGTEVLVGVCMERSSELIVALLAILKAGGAYVPLDPTYPQKRLAFMLEDAQAPVILTEERLAANFAACQARLVCLDTNRAEIAEQSEQNIVDSQMAGHHLAYVMYTSGSTGIPKGVCVPHRAIVRLVWNTNYIELGPADVVAQASNASFDAATFEIWGALLHGARLVIITKDVTLSPREFAAQLRQQGITTLFLTTSLFNQLAGEVPDAFQSLQHLLFGGEAGDPRRVREMLKHAPSRQLANIYGPTETTTFACYYRVHQMPDSVTNIPIGRPIANTQIYLLDRHLQPVPIGVAGELYIGGDGVARGYLNRPELTAARFVPHPFDEEAGARLYRTGDLARFLADGNIEFLGRIDHQIKIRGFRVELGEIETVLGQHPGVQEVVVVVREDVPGDRRLAAYVVARQESQPSAMELREYLRQKLPEYMVPSSFVLLESLPVTANGKVDRHALPHPEGESMEQQVAHVAPQTELERAITAIWQEVLSLEKVGTHDNFFDLGGYSLLLVRVQSSLRELLNAEISITDLFKYPAIHSLATFLSQEPSGQPAFEQVHERVRKQKEAMQRRRPAPKARSRS